jgi:hypothetical protein
MPDARSQISMSQTLVFTADDFNFETVEQQNGMATVVRFKVDDTQCSAGDVIVVLSGEEIHFHGMIGQIADGFAVASDTRGSLLTALVQ